MPISPWPDDMSCSDIADVLLWFERAVRDLLGQGHDRREAEEIAIPVVRARVMNDSRLSPLSGQPSLCLVCGLSERPDHPLVPVLSCHEGRHLWLHSGRCHQEHLTSQAEKAERVLQRAGLVA
jgi:hypothetical protein